jgi:alkanesulfonate monooxygenase SsuD/methylene tetrahydromethanopterin reductase-like flavin-dependent oxidoreductase (luciferase family)
MTKAHFGVTVPQIKRPWMAAAQAAGQFEAMGFDSIWVCDHLYGPQSPQLPILEAWTMVAALAAITERVEIGTLVTPAGMRNPAHLAKTIATADNIAGGRVIAGLGAGWMPREFSDFGMPFMATRERLEQLRETVELLRRMWDEEEIETTYQGTYVNVENVVCQPKPPRHVPILIGGAGEQVTLKLAAKEADMWNNLAGHQANLGHKIEVLKRHCDDLGRDFEEIICSQQCLVTIAADAASAGLMAEQAQKIFGGHMGDPQGPMAVTGTAEQCADAIHKHIELGCSMFVMEFFGRDTIEPAQRFAEEVIPQFA